MFIVIGTFRRARKDQEGETQNCETYAAAVKLRDEWRKSNRYKQVFIVKDE